MSFTKSSQEDNVLQNCTLSQPGKDIGPASIHASTSFKCQLFITEAQ